MEFGICQKCSNETYVNVNSICETCYVEMNPNPDEMRTQGMCHICGREDYVDENSVCDMCREHAETENSEEVDQETEY